MKFVLYSLNYAPELTGIGKYNGEMVESLVKADVDCTVLCAPPYYPEWRINSDYSGRRFTVAEDGRTKVIRCPIYVPSHVTTLKRIVHLISFAISSGFRLFGLFKKKPDIVFLVQPTLFCAPMTLLFCKLTGAKAVMHIQDFELDAMLGLGMGKNGRLTRLFRKIESFTLRRFDRVSTISHSMLAKAEEKGVDPDKLIFFPNWTDIGFVTPETSGAEFKRRLGLADTDKVVLYAGNIGKKQGLEIVLDAAANLKAHTNIKFLLVGTGAHVKELKIYAKQLKLENVLFLPLQEWNDVPQMLAMADVHLVIQKKGAADAVLPSKLTNILAAGGQAIVTAENDTELGRLASTHPGIYNLIEPESLEGLIDGLKRMLLKDLRLGVNTIAREYAERNLDKNAIITRFLSDIKSL